MLIVAKPFRDKRNDRGLQKDVLERQIMLRNSSHLGCRSKFVILETTRVQPVQVGHPSLLARANSQELKANLRAANTLIVLYLSFAGMMEHDRTQLYILRGGDHPDLATADFSNGGRQAGDEPQYFLQHKSGSVVLWAIYRTIVCHVNSLYYSKT